MLVSVKPKYLDLAERASSMVKFKKADKDPAKAGKGGLRGDSYCVIVQSFCVSVAQWRASGFAWKMWTHIPPLTVMYFICTEISSHGAPLSVRKSNELS